MALSNRLGLLHYFYMQSRTIPVALVLTTLLLAVAAGLAARAHSERSAPADTMVRIRGRVWSKSDVQTVPDTPLQAFVLVTTSRGRDSLLARHLLLEADSGRFVVASVHTDPLGRYSARVPSGRLWFGLVAIGEPRATLSYPVRVGRLVPIDISGPGPRKLDFFLGEGGLTVKP